MECFLSQLVTENNYGGELVICRSTDHSAAVPQTQQVLDGPLGDDLSRGQHRDPRRVWTDQLSAHLSRAPPYLHLPHLLGEEGLSGTHPLKRKLADKCLNPETSLSTSSLRVPSPKAYVTVRAPASSLAIRCCCSNISAASNPDRPSSDTRTVRRRGSKTGKPENMLVEAPAPSTEIPGIPLSRSRARAAKPTASSKIVSGSPSLSCALVASSDARRRGLGLVLWRVRRHLRSRSRSTR
ncbi:hypothetical protein Taro_000647 [Colocasia esculenta]|uniref:Uncharacterized protein n=1 Tax=Colocasia esculenta TaxID=4460 RepID=A0A843TDR6_COLES|nr:hypothetical protein [Colocasia esculenta]